LLADVARRIDWSALRPLPESFIGPELGELRADLVFSVTLDRRDAYLYVLLEHQSRSDRLMPLRILRYMIRIWDEHLRAHPDAVLLPPIVPIVVHHSAKGWKARRTCLRSLPSARATALRLPACSASNAATRSFSARSSALSSAEGFGRAGGSARIDSGRCWSSTRWAERLLELADVERPFVIDQDAHGGLRQLQAICAIACEPVVESRDQLAELEPPSFRGRRPTQPACHAQTQKPCRIRGDAREPPT
jgi:hypothetical protein